MEEEYIKKETQRKAEKDLEDATERIARMMMVMAFRDTP